MPSVSPWPTRNDTPRTACTMPSAVRNDTCRSSTSSSCTLPAPSQWSLAGHDPSTHLYALPARTAFPPAHAAAFAAAGAGREWCALVWLAQPDVRRVELLDRGHVHGVVHVAGVIVRLERVSDRVDRGVPHDHLVKLRPHRRGAARVALGRGPGDQAGHRRVVVEPVVAAHRREGTRAVEQR